ncbi:MAG: purine NTP phosphatase [Peptococcaceae bacterium BRH_c4b]|nr:MAG: purine NTP phosphatase [Peptococcaceae bacterium BRH_c4b]
MRLVLATRNRGKVNELAELLSPLGVEVLSLDNFPGVPEVEEDGDTFKANALKKALTVSLHTGEIALADDSGLEVDYLGGAPGVHSARFAGVGRDDLENNEKLLRLMKNVPPEKRTARFRCVVALATPEGRTFTTEGACEGIIGNSPRGGEGFGYDPLFVVPEFGKTFAELDMETKNRISHRGRAFSLATEIIDGIIDGKSKEPAQI